MYEFFFGNPCRFSGMVMGTRNLGFRPHHRDVACHPHVVQDTQGKCIYAHRCLVFTPVVWDSAHRQYPLKPQVWFFRDSNPGPSCQWLAADKAAPGAVSHRAPPCTSFALSPPGIRRLTGRWLSTCLYTLVGKM